MNHESHISYAKNCINVNTSNNSRNYIHIIIYCTHFRMQRKKNELASPKETIRKVAMYQLHCRKSIKCTFIKVLSFPMNYAVYFFFDFHSVRSIYYDSFPSIVPITNITLMHDALFTLEQVLLELLKTIY